MRSRGGAGSFPGGFSRRTVGWIVAVATISFLLSLVLGVFGRELGRGPSPHANSFSASLLGHRGFLELLRSLGLGMISRQNRAGIGTGPRVPLVVAEPDPGWVGGGGSHRLQALFEEARRRQAWMVLVLPKWHGEPAASNPRWLSSLDLFPTEEAARVVAAAAGPLQVAESIQRRERVDRRCDAPGLGGSSFAVDLAPAQLLEVKEVRLGGMPQPESLVRCGDGTLVALLPATGASPGLVVIADPDLLNNQGLARGDHAALMVRLLERLGAQGVVFDETVHGFIRSGGLLAELLTPPLLPASLHGLLLAGLVLWAGVGRFGSPRSEEPDLAAGKDVLVANTADLLAAGGHTAASLRRYFRQTVTEAARALHLPPSLDERATLKRLQEIAAGRGVEGDLTALRSRIGRLGTGPQTARDTEALDLARDLHHWYREVTRGA